MYDSSLAHVAFELLGINEDIRYRLGSKESDLSDYKLIDFEQLWGSTSLGFGGVGQQVATYARTYVFTPRNECGDCIVYFAGRFAYSVPYSDVFMADINRQRIESVHNIKKYQLSNI